jgi:cysteine synthase
MDYLIDCDRWRLPVVPIIPELNPFAQDGVDVFAALAYELPFHNIKTPTILGMLQHARAAGALEGVHTLVEATSGNTGFVLAMLASVFDIRRVQLVVAPDIPDGKRYPLICAGATLVTPEAGLSGVATARQRGGGGWKAEGWCPDNGYLNLDQYANPANSLLHEKWVGPKIWEEMNGDLSVFCAGIGTGGTLCGISRCLRDRAAALTVVGVLRAPGQEVPGVREEARMKEISLPWREAAGVCVEVSTRPSYAMSLWFAWRMGLTLGPSAGFAYLGLLKFLAKQKQDGTLDALRSRDGRIRAAVLFADTFRPYGDRFTAHLPLTYLHPSTAPQPSDLMTAA